MAEEEEDPWSDGDGDGGEGPRESEWQSRNFHTLGYRDGLFAGKESSAQKGFDAGFKESAPAGFDWGIARGITSAFAALSPRHQELLAPDKNARDDLKSLHDSISGISSNDALASYHSHQKLAAIRKAGFPGSHAAAAKKLFFGIPSLCAVATVDAVLIDTNTVNSERSLAMILFPKYEPSRQGMCRALARVKQRTGTFDTEDGSLALDRAPTPHRPTSVGTRRVPVPASLNGSNPYPKPSLFLFSSLS
ncbi:hypothetical protein SELMODRAFT_443506 [Selaginella moellendorffii]|uniref:Essential protein Yae1 N-terminal domain-containing protein n=1 Tax=Selaginella moellendorffii TaxID=88036 RepID=D8S1U8_SELML|nr:hypothetical protein SELMODRAFT_443506 [Selaginella moellendorffii]